jgi:glycogen debranching enzyme
LQRGRAAGTLPVASRRGKNIAMSLEIKVGPPQLAIHHGQSVLVTEPDGSIPWPSDRGLYVRDTRIISHWAIYANGELWELLSSATPGHDLARIFLTNRKFVTEAGPIAERTLDFAVTRRIEGGFHEDLDLTNHSGQAVQFNLEVALRCDFADIFEVKADRIVRRGHIATDWSAGGQVLLNSYRNADFHRAVAVRVEADGPAVYANGRISFEVTVAPGASWHACLIYQVFAEGVPLQVPVSCTLGGAPKQSTDGVKAWRDQVLKLETPNPVMQRLYDQAIDDMAALRLPIESTDHLQFVPAAGLPWFVALFGRDSLIVSLQNLLIWPGFARGALDVLGRWQAQERDDWRDAEPGKIPHELRMGELAHFRLIPHTPYYGTADATPLYLVVLYAAWQATGDRSLLEKHLPVAERCLSWIDEWGDRDGDGFQEYGTRSKDGYENQGWKDSGDGVLHEDGSMAHGPKALCELQGYVYDAWRRMAEVYDALGRGADAANLRRKAQALFDRFNEVFWDEELGFYIFALDGDKRPVRSIVSNVGHCLWSGIVRPDRAARVVQRMMEPDMSSGWGIRTLSAKHPAFNPNSYHLGSVWPHDNGIAALGFRRYGFVREAVQIAADVGRAGSFFTYHQLPELYAGTQRDETNFPVQYLGANVPQAWAAGSVFHLMNAVLGLRPDAPAGKLYVDPHLPDWLPEVCLRDLCVGETSFDLLFRRQGDSTQMEVLRGDPDCVERRDFEVGS